MNCQFKQAQLEKSFWELAGLQQCDFTDAQLFLADFSCAQLTESVFDGADLHRAKLHQLESYKSQLRSAHLKGVSWTDQDRLRGEQRAQQEFSQ